MRLNTWVKVLLSAAIAFCLSRTATAGEKINWLLKHNPAVVIKSGKGRSEKFRITEFKRTSEVQTQIGMVAQFEAVMENSGGKVSVLAAEGESYPVLVLWLNFPKGLSQTSINNPYGVGAGIEFDRPADLPRTLAFSMTSFAPPESRIVPSAGPLVFYNDRFETVLISPLDHFLVSMIAGEGSRVQAGLEGDLKSIPAGFQHPVVFYFGKGICASFDGWGEIVRKWHKKERPSPYADVALSYLGYWTDNGAFYYYHTEKGLTYEQTLLKVKQEADKLGVPFGYFQIDSWWYRKTSDSKKGFGSLDVLKHWVFGGATRWEARSELFLEGLAAFDRKLGVPLEAHARWFDQKNDYRKEYKFVDGVSSRRPALPVEERFWDMIMGNAKSWGIQVYEQDWLDTQWRSIPYLRESVDAGDKWLGAMATAAQKQGLTIQYCMANPGFFMQALKYPNVTQVRTSNDYMAGMPKQIHWVPFTKTSMLAWAVGLYPWKDVFLSSEGERTVRNERRAEEEALISVLSAAMVGPGDKLGFINKDLLMKTCRADGLLLKPDRPAMPIDKMFVENKTLYTTVTETRTGIGVYYYVAGYNIFPSDFRERELSFADLGVTPGNYLVYSWKDRKFSAQKDKVVYPEKLDIYRSAYFVLVPDQGKAPSLIGEPDKFVPVSNARFKKVEVKAGKLRLTVAGVPGEEITLAFRAESKLSANILSGASAGDSSYDVSRKIFTVRVKLISDQTEMEVGP